MIARLLVLVVLFAGLACSTPTPVTGTKRVSVESQRSLRVAGGTREIQVDVGQADTVFRFGEATIVCRDYQGYVGDFASDRGWARVGRLELSWDGNRLRVRSRQGWAVVPLDAETRLFAEQDGEMGRSIFRAR